MSDARHATVMDDEARQVSRVYAEALYKAAEQKGEVDRVLEDIEGLALGVFGEDPGLELFFASASISKDKKAQAIAAAFGGSASSFKGFLDVLNQHDRLGMVRPIAATFRRLYDKRHQKVVVEVRSAIALTDEDRERLKGDLRAATGLEPTIHETVAPALLGGLVVRVNEWVFDGSVRTRLESIKNQLIERGSHGVV
ncbi:MAG: ATP synthase F1 subunit delta [Gemmataceae bacterium]|nr:ATP synthase F1 subunit delta [Gemmataceae bacterium]